MLKDAQSRLSQAQSLLKDAQQLQHPMQRRISRRKTQERLRNIPCSLTGMIREAQEVKREEKMDKFQQSVWFDKDNELTMEYVQLAVKMLKRGVVIVGVYLQKNIIDKVMEVLIGKPFPSTRSYASGSFRCVRGQSIDNAHVQIMFWVMQSCAASNTERKSIRQSVSAMEIESTLTLSNTERIFFNYSQILVTSEQQLSQIYLKRRGYGTENVYGMDQSVLLICRDTNIRSMTSLTEYHYFDVCRVQESDLLEKQITRKKSQMNCNAFKQHFTGLVLTNVKHNWRISITNGTKLGLYILSSELKNTTEDYNRDGIITNALNSHLADAEAEFLQKVQKYPLPMDELELRQSLEREKKACQMAFMVAMECFMGNYSQSSVGQRYCEKLWQTIEEKEYELYQINLTLATKHNQQMLQQLSSSYLQLVEQSLVVRDQQKEFHELLEQYSIRSIRVSSQLKTFNNHMIAHKAEYLEHITRSLKTQKVFRASGAHEAQELIEMETGLLETLETQVSQLQEKRKAIEVHNLAMKQEIDQLEQGLKYPSMSLDFASEISTNKLKGKISPSSRKIKIPKTAKQINDKSKKDKDLEGRKSCCCLI